MVNHGLLMVDHCFIKKLYMPALKKIEEDDDFFMKSQFHDIPISKLPHFTFLDPIVLQCMLHFQRQWLLAIVWRSLLGQEQGGKGKKIG
jgi:hypothetical protein